MRDIAKEARSQGFQLGSTNHDHLFLRCPEPRCAMRVTFSKTVAGNDKKAFPKVRNLLLKHGFSYQGRGGEHTAEFFGGGGSS